MALDLLEPLGVESLRLAVVRSIFILN
jgi:hypothetical protein